MVTNEITETLQEFGDAIASDDYESAEAALNELSELYGSVRAEEMGVVYQLRAGMDEAPLSNEEHQNAREYLGQKTSTNLARTGILSGGKMYLIDPYEADKTEIVEGVSQLIEHETKLQEREETAREILADVDLPASVSILRVSGPDAQPVVGDSVMLDVVVKNVGEEVATGVGVMCEARLDVTPTSGTIGELDPGEEGTVSFEFRGEEDDYDLRFIVESDNAGSDFNETVLSVVAKSSSIETATGTIDEIRELVIGKEALGDGWTTALLASLDSATASIDEALQYIEGETDSPGRGPPGDSPGRGPPDEHPGRGPPDNSPTEGSSGEKDANNALTTAINQLGAFLNKVADFREESDEIEDSYWYTLQKRAELAIDQLDWARHAEMDGESEAFADDPEEGRGPPDDDDHPGRGPPDDDDDDDHPGRGPPDDDDDDDDHPGRGPP